jgi:LPXTG-motif cell wall-anchored protein
LAHSVTALSRSTNTGDGRVVIQYVLPAPTQTTLTVTPTSTRVGTTVTLTAKVSSTAGTPGGQVVFTEGSVTLGKAAAVNGVATLQINAGQTVGTRSFTARYLGAPTFAVSSSSVATLSVTAPPVTSQAVDAELANTGNGTGLQVALALGALGFGAAVLYLARRRSPLKSRG